MSWTGTSVGQGERGRGPAEAQVSCHMNNSWGRSGSAYFRGSSRVSADSRRGQFGLARSLVVPLRGARRGAGRDPRRPR